MKQSIVAVVGLICAIVLPAQTVTFSSFGIPSSGAGPSSMTVAGGAMWFVENGTGKIAKVTTGGTVTEFPTGITPGNVCSAQITLGPDNNLWVTFGNPSGPNTHGPVVKMSLSGAVLGTFSTDQPASCVGSITSGPDGNLWTGQLVLASDRIEQLIPSSGTFNSEFVIPPGGGPQPMGIVTGPDNNLWFTEFSGFSVTRVTTAGVFTRVLLPGVTPNGMGGFTGPPGFAAAEPLGITSGPDGNLWFTEFGANKVGKVSTAATPVISDFSLPTSGAFPVSIVTGPDGALWFTESGSNKLGRITTAGSISEFAITSGSGPGSIVLGPDGNLWFTESTSNTIAKAVISAAPPTPPTPATPAPASLVLTLAGFAALGLYIAARKFARAS